MGELGRPGGDHALGIDADEVLKTLAVRTGPGYVLVVIPAARRLDLRLVREVLGDNHARLASEEELGRDFPDYQLGALPHWGPWSAPTCTSIPRCWGTTRRCLRPALRPSRSRWEPRSCSEEGGFTTVALVRRPERGSDDSVA